METLDSIRDRLTREQLKLIMEFRRELVDSTDLSEAEIQQRLMHRAMIYVSNSTAPSPVLTPSRVRTSVRWLVECRNCGGHRPARAPAGGRLPLGFCDGCSAKRSKRRRRQPAQAAS